VQEYTHYNESREALLVSNKKVSETWAATESELQKLLIFELKILRKIYGPVKDRDNWRIRTN
jgi:hypothetical protein